MEIFTAIEKGNLEKVKALIEADLNLLHAQDKNRDGLLHLAAWHAQPEIAKFLIEKGIDLEMKNRENRTALHNAFESSSRKIEKLLKDHGANVDINLAAGWGDEKRMRELLDTNPKLANDISTGITALEWAAYGDADKGIDILVEYGADVNFRHPNGGFTAFFPAAETNHVRAAKALLKNGGDFRVANDNGDTPLHYAAVMRFTTDAVPYARFLLENGADVNAKNKQGLTPLALMQKARNSQKDNWHPSAPKLEVKNFTGMEALLKEFGGKE